MNKKKKNLVLKAFVGLFLAGVFSMNLCPCICANGAGDGYSNEGSAGKSTRSSMIETYIIEGGGSFLNAQSDILLFLNKIEMSALKGIDFSELQAIIHNAIYHMREAKLSYDNLIKVAEVTPYNTGVINKLVSFNYNEFCDEKNLNPIIFKKVKEYLNAGDITGTYRKINSKFNKILGLLDVIKSEISLNKTPELADLWKLYQECSHTLLFGQYIAEVFYEIRGK